MRARRSGEAAFLVRMDAEWVALGTPERYVWRLQVLARLGWFRLARAKAFRPYEVARLRQISTGMEPHPKVDAATALTLLRLFEGEPECVLPEVCREGRRPGCGCESAEESAAEEELAEG